MEAQLQPIYQMIIEGQYREIAEKVKIALQAGITPNIVLEEAMIAAMAEVGRLFEAGEFYVPELLMASRAMQAGLAIIKPCLAETHFVPAGKVAIGTVKGDLHDIGKNLVGMMLEGAGFEILDLGTDVPPEKFVEVADQVHVIAVSALLTTTMVNIKLVMDALIAAGKREQVKVVVGGAPVTSEFAASIGADGSAPDASRAVTLVKNLL